MPTEQKTAIIDEIKGRLQGAEAIIMTDYRGLSVTEMQELRSRLREQGGELSVYKNRLTRIAMRELDMPDMSDVLQGPTAFLFIHGDPVAPAKALTTFAKEHEVLEVKGGIVTGQVVDATSIKALAALPSREELIAKLLGTIQNPMVKTVRVLNGPASAFARVLGAIADQKQNAA